MEGPTYLLAIDLKVLSLYCRGRHFVKNFTLLSRFFTYVGNVYPDDVFARFLVSIWIYVYMCIIYIYVFSINR